MYDIKSYINNTKYDLQNKHDRCMFEIELSIYYGIKFQKYVRKELDICYQKIVEDRRLVLQYVSKDLIKYIEMFCRLDKEFIDNKKNISKLNSKNKKLIIDTQWRGFWLKATGNDFSLFVNWIRSGIRNSKYRDQDFMYWHIQETKEKFAPYSVIIANDIFNKYYRNNL